MRHSTQEERDDYEAMLECKSTVLTASEEFERLKAENARLRNLLQEAVNMQLEDCGDCWGGLCVECGCWVAEREKELRELRIEVDE